MSTSFNPNRGFQGDDFQSGCTICKSMDLTEYYGQKGGASKKAKKPSTSKKAKKPSTAKKAKKRGGADTLDKFVESNMSIPWATQAGGTQLASEYYTSAQQGSYAPYNASKDEKCGGGRKKRVVRGGIGMGEAEGKMGSSMGNMDGSMNGLDGATKPKSGGGCGCGYKSKTSGTKRGGGDTYYADTITGSDPVVEKKTILEGQLNGGAKKKRSSSKGPKKATKPRSSSKGPKKATKPKSSRKLKLRGGDDSAGGGSDFISTFNSWGPINTTSVTDKAYFPIFNKSTEYMSKDELVNCAVAPEFLGCAPPSDGPVAYNADFTGGTKKKKPTKKSSSSKSKAKPAKKSASKSKSKPAKKSGSSKSKAKKH